VPIKLRAIVATQRSSGALCRVTLALTASYRVPVKARLLIYKSGLALCVKNIKGPDLLLKGDNLRGFPRVRISSVL
jgi:hypothetical protein